jgi:hypothetical protein
MSDYIPRLPTVTIHEVCAVALAMRRPDDDPRDFKKYLPIAFEFVLESQRLVRSLGDQGNPKPPEPVASGFFYAKGAESTSYRERYSEMPPLPLNASPYKSEVIMWILETERENGEELSIEEADRRRETARHLRPKIWNFDLHTKLWQGVNFSPS